MRGLDFQTHSFSIWAPKQSHGFLKVVSTLGDPHEIWLLNARIEGNHLAEKSVLCTLSSWKGQGPSQTRCSVRALRHQVPARGPLLHSLKAVVILMWQDPPGTTGVTSVSCIACIHVTAGD